MRAVLDTNVLVRATKNASGPARELLRQFEAEQHVLIVSNAILVELLRVLDYPRVLPSIGRVNAAPLTLASRSITERSKSCRTIGACIG